jgi:hypothetical protein
MEIALAFYLYDINIYNVLCMLADVDRDYIVSVDNEYFEVIL